MTAVFPVPSPTPLKSACFQARKINISEVQLKKSALAEDSEYFHRQALLFKRPLSPIFYRSESSRIYTTKKSFLCELLTFNFSGFYLSGFVASLQ